MRRSRKVMMISLMMLAMFIVPGVVLAQGTDTATTATSGDIATLLMPLAAAATAIERIIEMIFNWYESIVLNAGSLLGEGKGYLGWARDEMNAARKAFNQPEIKDDRNALAKAELQLMQAEERLQEYLKSPFYISQKRALTLVLGIVLGILIAFMTRLQMLKLLLGVELNSALAGVDMLITGLVIGTGSAPVHSLIGLLQNTKDAVYEARTLWRGKSVAALGIPAAYADLIAAQTSTRQPEAESTAEDEDLPTSMAFPGGEQERPPAALPEDLEYQMLQKRRMVQNSLR